MLTTGSEGDTIMEYDYAICPLMWVACEPLDLPSLCLSVRKLSAEYSPALPSSHSDLSAVTDRLTLLASEEWSKP